MKKTTKTIVRAISLTLAAIMIAASFAGCSLKEMSWKMTYNSILKQLNEEYGTVNFVLYDLNGDNSPEMITEVSIGDSGTILYDIFDAKKGSNRNDCRIDGIISRYGTASIYPDSFDTCIIIKRAFLMQDGVEISKLYYFGSDTEIRDFSKFNEFDIELTPFNMIRSNSFNLFKLNWKQNTINNNHELLYSVHNWWKNIYKNILSSIQETYPCAEYYIYDTDFDLVPELFVSCNGTNMNGKEVLLFDATNTLNGKDAFVASFGNNPSAIYFLKYDNNIVILQYQSDSSSEILNKYTYKNKSLSNKEVLYDENSSLGFKNIFDMVYGDLLDYCDFYALQSIVYDITDTFFIDNWF